jgi:hypothetical protein
MEIMWRRVNRLRHRRGILRLRGGSSARRRTRGEKSRLFAQNDAARLCVDRDRGRRGRSRETFRLLAPTRFGERTSPPRFIQPGRLQELYQRVRRGLGLLFHQPMPGILNHDYGYVRRHQFYLRSERISQRFVAADRENGHRQFGL